MLRPSVCYAYRLWHMIATPQLQLRLEVRTKTPLFEVPVRRQAHGIGWEWSAM